jgi:hypothetical protein
MCVALLRHVSSAPHNRFPKRRQQIATSKAPDLNILDGRAEPGRLASGRGEEGDTQEWKQKSLSLSCRLLLGHYS